MMVWLAGACLGPWEAEWGPADSGLPGEGVVTGPIVADTTWGSEVVWILDDIVYVEEGAVLSIEAGTTVLGQQGSALVVTKGSQLVARGLRAAPIVFTSAQPVGQRSPGDWGGVVLLGEARVAGEPPFVVEGLEGTDARGEYGGTDDLHDCGRLEYVRIEFAGYESFPGNELNGLTLGGCGAFTYLQNVQVHRGLDDGVEMFGGTVNLKQVVVTGAGDDGFDWDQGWRGRGQFLISQQYPGTGDKALEGDGIVGTNAADQSSPRLYNVGLYGSGDPSLEQGGLHLREETRAEIRNLLAVWQTGRGIDVDGLDTAANATSGDLTVSDSVFSTQVPNPQLYDDPIETGDNDGGFDERGWLEADPSNHLDVDPQVTPPATAAEWAVDPRSQWIPPLSSVAGTGHEVAAEDGFWDTVGYIGAVAPGTGSPWWEPWVSFPED